MKGRLVVFEGIDGAGTETQSKKLCQHLLDNGMPAVRLEYPDYSGPIGHLIHEFLHGKYELSEETLFLLHVTDKIKDRDRINRLLDEGKTVVCDRYYTAILGYQCSHGIPLKKALDLAEMFDVPKPDVIFYLSIRPETSLMRKGAEKGGRDSLDRNEADMEKQQRLVEYYDKLVRDQVWSSWYAINGEKPIEEVFGQVMKVLNI